MATPEGVEVVLPTKQQAKKKGTKAPATLNQFEADATQPPPAVGKEDDVPACGLSAAGFWALFVVGWILPPCWWVGVAVGLKSGKDSEFLMLKRKKLSVAQNAAWWACVIMSLVSALVLILVLAIYFGKKAPVQEGEFESTIITTVAHSVFIMYACMMHTLIHERLSAALCELIDRACFESWPALLHA
jgi:hypothetical protein